MPLTGAGSSAGQDAVAAQPRMLVGTFHKTGTVLMLTLLRRISAELGYPLALAGRATPPPGWRIHFHPHSAFAREYLAAPHRGVIVIRDPRDVIISGAHYHCRADARRDPWLYVPDPRFGGRSYHEMILSRRGAEARLMFEMTHWGGRTLAHMATLAVPPPGFIHARLEDLSTDRELKTFRHMFTWLGLPPAHVAAALAIAAQISLFGETAERTHVRSGRPAQWREEFTPAVHAAFRARFGDLPERLGYPAA
jgi:hypothetical protein